MDEHDTLRIDTSIYSKTSVFRACYKFTDRAYIFLSREADAPDQILVFFTAKSEGEALKRIIGEFSNELVDQALREILDQRFGPLKNLIVAQAFAEGNLLEEAKEGEVGGSRER